MFPLDQSVAMFVCGAVEREHPKFGSQTLYLVLAEREIAGEDHLVMLLVRPWASLADALRAAIGNILSASFTMPARESDGSFGPAAFNYPRFVNLRGIRIGEEG